MSLMLKAIGYDIRQLLQPSFWWLVALMWAFLDVAIQRVHVRRKTGAIASTRCAKKYVTAISINRHLRSNPCTRG